MRDHLDRLLEGGQGNRESVNALMADDYARWAKANLGGATDQADTDA
ncbi:hypothetical protein SEA_GUDMIT_70 [Gordonia phage Gudmit]|nr:hypothetical protein SEA_GUDMIT_70 [Gordonia phage Gudmit]